MKNTRSIPGIVKPMQMIDEFTEKFINSINNEEYKKIIDNMKVSPANNKLISYKAFKSAKKEKQMEILLTMVNYYNGFFKSYFKINNIEQRTFDPLQVRTLIDEINEENATSTIAILLGMCRNTVDLRSAVFNKTFDKYIGNLAPSTEKPKIIEVEVAKKEIAEEIVEEIVINKEEEKVKLLLNEKIKQNESLKNEKRYLESQLDDYEEFEKKYTADKNNEIINLKKQIELGEKFNKQLNKQKEEMKNLLSTYENMLDESFSCNKKKYIIILDNDFYIFKFLFADAYVVNEQEAYDLFENCENLHKIACVFAQRKIIGLDEKEKLMKKYNLKDIVYLCEEQNKRLLMELCSNIFDRRIGD